MGGHVGTTSSSYTRHRLVRSKRCSTSSDTHCLSTMKTDGRTFLAVLIERDPSAAAAAFDWAEAEITVTREAPGGEGIESTLLQSRR